MKIAQTARKAEKQTIDFRLPDMLRNRALDELPGAFNSTRPHIYIGVRHSQGAHGERFRKTSGTGAAHRSLWHRFPQRRRPRRYC